MFTVTRKVCKINVKNRTHSRLAQIAREKQIADLALQQRERRHVIDGSIHPYNQFIWIHKRIAALPRKSPLGFQLSCKL